MTHRRRHCTAFMLALSGPLLAEDGAIPAPAPAPTATSAAPAPASSVLAPLVATAAGVDAWAKLTRLRFTWRHVPKDAARSYDWHPRSDADGGDVTITMPAPSTGNDDQANGPTNVTLPAKWHAPASSTPPGSTPGPAAAAGTSNGAKVKAHQAFINDSYWLLFSLHLAWDGATTSDLGEVDVPQLPDLGKRPAVSVSYPSAGGYTPGDRYVLYLGADHLPVAWAFHKGGAAEPTLVTRWLDYQTVGGLHLPTRFTTPDGKEFIRIEGLSAE